MPISHFVFYGVRPILDFGLFIITRLFLASCCCLVHTSECLVFIMVHESTMICFDNSEYMRNGDFVPTRLQAQQDAANLIVNCKIRSNPENGVGVIAMGEKVDVLSTLSQDTSKLFMKLHQVQIRGECLFSASIRVANLALKHRQNRNHKPRIVVFVGSPITSEGNDELVKLGKKLKKEKVSVDVVCFGESDTENVDKMTHFLDTLNGKDGTGSHLVVVPSGAALSDALASSPVCRGEDGSGAPVAVPGGGGAGGFDLGFDPSEDPELAMALRVSLEDQRQRQEREAQQAAEESAAESGGGGGGEEMEGGGGGNVNLDALTEEEQLAMALRMSMGNEEGASAAPMEVDEGSEETREEDLGHLMSDPTALQELISTLPGVQSSDALIQQIQETTQHPPKNPTGPKKDGEDDKKTNKEDKPGDGSSGSKP